MIVLLGGRGYIGRAFVFEMARQHRSFAALSRLFVDYTDPRILHRYLSQTRPDLVINVAGYTGKPNVDACETALEETMRGNVELPAVVNRVCGDLGIPWAHVSSGCIYSGDNGGAGFSEDDPPNFCFECPPCSVYSGSKAAGERVASGAAYIWRLRIPFDEFDGARNYLSKLRRYSRLLRARNSLSHRSDFARACLACWDLQAPRGVYNLTNPGSVTTEEVAEMIREREPWRKFDFFSGDDEFYREAAIAPRSNCVLDVSKALNAGIALRPVREALADALDRWRPECEF